MAQSKIPAGLILSTITAFTLTWIFSVDLSAKVNFKFLAPPPEQMEYFNFGFKESMADSLWLRWIQDADVCYAYSGTIANLDFLDSKEKGETDEFYNPRHKKCDQSWGFKMLDTITRLDPKFLMPYLAGTMALSVLVEDYEGASVIFDRGIENYPHDWTLAYRAAYHFLFDKKEYAKAAHLLEVASDEGGPAWLKSLAARVYSRSGQLELGIRTLRAYRELNKDNPKYVKEIDGRIRDMEAEMLRERAGRPQ